MRKVMLDIVNKFSEVIQLVEELNSHPVRPVRPRGPLPRAGPRSLAI